LRRSRASSQRQSASSTRIKPFNRRHVCFYSVHLVGYLRRSLASSRILDASSRILDDKMYNGCLLGWHTAFPRFSGWFLLQFAWALFRSSQFPEQSSRHTRVVGCFQIRIGCARFKPLPFSDNLLGIRANRALSLCSSRLFAAPFLMNVPGSWSAEKVFGCFFRKL
jgi:hypothetical protein